MRSVDVETEVVIHCARPEVASYAMDPDHATSWYRNIRQVEWKSEPPLAVGSWIAFVARFLGRELRYTYEVVELVPDQRFVMRTSDGPFPMETVIPKSAAMSLIRTPGSRFNATRTTSSRNSFGKGLGMVNILPAAPSGTTDQMSPRRAAVPIEMSRPGELVHVDIKKLGRIPAGGGWRAHGRANVTRLKTKPVGYAFIHAAVDGYSRTAYAEIHPDEKGVTAAGFWTRAHTWFADHGVRVERVLTDNGACYRSDAFAAALGGITHTFTRPYRPQTNGKVKRFNRTLLDDWAYVRVYRSEHQRTQALHRWLHLYNHHRSHTSLAGQAPMTRLSNVPGQYT